ncbi:MAG: hypothetical protein FWD60_04030 [Candidatus Azobacteroides sp.]|nr:hypothetical protein [Candidatus Azobacteroides sp.]
MEENVKIPTGTSKENIKEREKIISGIYREKIKRQINNRREKRQKENSILHYSNALKAKKQDLYRATPEKPVFSFGVKVQQVFKLPKYFSNVIDFGMIRKIIREEMEKN